MARGRPDFQLGIAGCVHGNHHIVAAVVHFQTGNGLRVAAVEALGNTQDRRQRLHRAAQCDRQLRVLVV